MPRPAPRGGPAHGRERPHGERDRGPLRSLTDDDCILDGEIVALGADGKPSFNALQNRAGLSSDAAGARGHHRVEPRLVAEVTFANWTEGERLRAPVFLRLRDDIDPGSVRRRAAAPAEAMAPRREAPPARPKRRSGEGGPASPEADPRRSGNDETVCALLAALDHPITALDEPEPNREGFERGRQVAFRLEDVLDRMALESCVKTSGETGLHVVVPIARTLRYDYDVVRAHGRADLPAPASHRLALGERGRGIGLCCSSTAGGVAMSSLRRTLDGGTTLHTILPRGVGMIWLLAMAWVLILGERTHHPVFTSHDECGTDPVDILRAGEILDGSSLRFIVDSHCSNARFLPHGWIELSYGGMRVDVETKELDVAGATYYQVVSIGGMTAP